MKIFTTLPTAALACVTLLGGITQLRAQTSAFTYQGQLNDNGGAANGAYDLQFTLYNAATIGIAQGSPVTQAPVNVSNGLFTVTLDFGSSVLDGSDRWLEIGVRTNGSVAAYTLLNPRQALTATPYAVQALTAGNAASFTGAITDSQLSGNIARLDGSNVFSGVVQLNNTSNTFNGTFAGNGASVTNVSIGTLNASGALSWPGHFVLASSPGVGNAPRSVAAADVNGDGKVDLACANTDGTMTVLTNDGSGSFVASSTNSISFNSRSIAAADVNQDDKPDVICTGSGPGVLMVLTNNGSGFFVPASTNNTGPGAGNVQGVAVGDVNGDGKVDLISANGNSPGTLTVFTNTGSGFVLASTNLVVGNNPFAVTTADVNSDGKLDLISANNSASGTLSVLTNNGSGGFVLSSTNGVGNSPRAVTAADVDGDGRTDLISANIGNGTLSVLINNGSGGFLAPLAFSAGTSPAGVTAVDLNGDGKMDLICANNTVPGTLTALTNNGSGFFVTSFTVSVGNVPYAVIAPDVNGDGKVDLVSVNGTSPGTLSVLFNMPTFNGAFSGDGGGLYNIQGGAIVPNSIPGTSIVTASISGSAIEPGSLVTSLNSLKDDVVLQAGSNATLNATGNTLTIASTGAGIWNLNDANTYFTSGKVAIGTNSPNHRLRIAGGPAWTSYGWGGAIELENASAMGWRANAGGQCFGIGQTTGGLLFFRSTSNPGTTATVANYDMQITDAGNVMIAGGTERPGVKLQVNGNAAFGPLGSGGEIAFGSPNGESGMTIIGSARADVRFDGSSLKLLAGPVGGPPSTSVGGISIATSGKVGIGTASPAGALHVASGGLAVTGASSPYTGAGAGVFLESGGASGNLFAFNYSTFTPRTLLLNSPGGSVGVGAATSAKLNVDGGNFGYGTPAFRAVNTPGLAGEFVGRVTVSESLVVSGSISKGGGSFKIDHPLDPANKYLSHSFVESPDMMNIYNGNIALDEKGEAVVRMPTWFNALNKDFRYQLTAIGAPGPNLYVAEEISGNQFKIAGGKAGTKVSWQVTGVRQDAYANAHRVKVEEEKVGSERGTYMHPDLFGQISKNSIVGERE